MKGKSNFRLLALGWWWEIGATVLSLTSLSLIITLLTYINDAPLSDWPLPIQPNSLLAVLTTAMKTSMLVSVTSCIGQLKWRHFATRARSIHELESLDDASRGPWGAFMLIITLRARSLMSICLAISSLLALGLEPSTQQIINVETRNITVPSDSALTSRAEAYFSAEDREVIAFGDDDRPKIKKDELDLQKAFNSVLAGSVREPYYKCPEIASRCIWDDFSTFAVCSHFQNVTDIVSYSCDFGSNYSKSNDTGNVTCAYQYPDDMPFTKGVPHNSPLEFTNIFLDGIFKLGETMKHTDVNSTATIASLWVMKINPNLEVNPPQPIDFNSSTTFLRAFESYFSHSYESYVLDLYWCNKTFRAITTSGSGLTAELAASMPWKSCSQFPEEAERRCYYWSTFITDNSLLNPSPIPYLYSSDPESQYNISLPKFQSMMWFIRSLKEDLLEYFNTEGVDVETTTANMAAALTEYMLRPQGDNLNVTTVTGYIIVSEAYIHTEWI
ncbi:hypothetical protein F4860DRAFT_488855 [Xylaria cubensis]|nr:hypothetical protein F4860DRAFT_488855 [Xylaria cubensis]